LIKCKVGYIYGSQKFGVDGLVGVLRLEEVEEGVVDVVEVVVVGKDIGFIGGYVKVVDLSCYSLLLNMHI